MATTNAARIIAANTYACIVCEQDRNAVAAITYHLPGAEQPWNSTARVCETCVDNAPEPDDVAVKHAAYA